MKKLIIIALTMVSLSAFAQNPVDKVLGRFNDPDNPQSGAFLAKGGRSIGISGSYRLFDVTGANEGDGYSILSILNIGQGKMQIWNVSPRFAWFVADDTSLGFRLGYSGYLLDTNLQLDFRDILNADPKEENLNIQLSHRHMIHHKVGAAFTARRYKSLFGSKMLGVFAEGRLFGNYGFTFSHPIPKNGGEVTKLRESSSLSIGLEIAGGAALRLKDNSVITVSVPLVGVVWQRSHQDKFWNMTDAQKDEANMGSATMNEFKIARNVELLGVQVGYSRYILSKNKKKK